MKDIFYVNASGKKLDLLSEEFSLQTGTLFNHGSGYSVSNLELAGFSDKLFEKELLLTVSGSEAMDLFSEYTETDVLNGTPGRLYCGDYYQQCFLYGAELMEWEYDAGYMDKRVKLVTDNPFWITEQTISIAPVTEETSSGGVKGYPYGYPYGYAKRRSVASVLIDHYAASDFRLIAYGPAANVYITISGHVYSVEYPVGADEYLVIDSRDFLPPDERIFLVRNNGEKVNVFNYRDPVHSVFEKIPPGRITIDYPRTYGIDLTIFKERSEPKWS